MTVKKEEIYVGRKFMTEYRRNDFDRGIEVIWEMISSAKKLSEYNLTPGTKGNISVMGCDGMYIKAGGKSLSKLTPEDIVFVLDYDVKENKALVCGDEEPSSETPMHWLIYRNIPRAGAIVHVHDHTVLGNIAVAEKLKIKITEKEAEYGTVEQANQVIESLSYDNYVIIKNHGSLAVGSSVGDAMGLTIKIHEKILEEIRI